jgi:hypothetical protein
MPCLRTAQFHVARHFDTLGVTMRTAAVAADMAPDQTDAG